MTSSGHGARLPLARKRPKAHLGRQRTDTVATVVTLKLKCYGREVAHTVNIEVVADATLKIRPGSRNTGADAGADAKKAGQYSNSQGKKT